MSSREIERKFLVGRDEYAKIFQVGIGRTSLDVLHGEAARVHRMKGRARIRFRQREHQRAIAAADVGGQRPLFELGVDTLERRNHFRDHRPFGADAVAVFGLGNRRRPL